MRLVSRLLHRILTSLYIVLVSKKSDHGSGSYEIPGFFMADGFMPENALPDDDGFPNIDVGIGGMGTELQGVVTNW